jgi:hypothetical protein
MLKKHIRALSLVLVLCLIAVMFTIMFLIGSIGSDAATVSEIMLLIFVSVACVPIFLAHEKHD